MAGKVVLITGGTGGIGKATANGLAALGARVAITGRDLGRGEAAAVDVRDATGNPNVDAFGADLSSQAEVRRLAAEVLGAYPRLDVLVNNVGGFWATRHVTADGLEHTFAVNYLAGFLLTDLLLDRLKASAPARVVTVSSGAQSLGKIDFEDLQGERDYSGQTAYNQSKLASVMFTYELARRLQGTSVTATVLHPGVVRTGFGAEDPSRIFKGLVPLWRPFMKTPQQGAATSIHLASSPEVEGVTGAYFAKGRPQTSNKASYDEDAATRLWQVSADLVGLTDFPPAKRRLPQAALPRGQQCQRETVSIGIAASTCPRLVRKKPKLRAESVATIGQRNLARSRRNVVTMTTLVRLSGQLSNLRHELRSLFDAL